MRIDHDGGSIPLITGDTAPLCLRYIVICVPLIRLPQFFGIDAI